MVESIKTSRKKANTCRLAVNVCRAVRSVPESAETEQHSSLIGRRSIQTPTCQLQPHCRWQKTFFHFRFIQSWPFAEDSGPVCGGCVTRLVGARNVKNPGTNGRQRPWPHYQALSHDNVWSNQVLWEQTYFDFTVGQCVVSDQHYDAR